jgi:exodeoxyribonuclease VII large subunit
VIIYPTPVQGKGAAKLIANAIHTANKRNEVDTLIICRGGGSLEDLWQFNEEVVARAIDECNIPTISGVGHETDFTICDFVADLRAATPTAAAELACTDIGRLKQHLAQLQNQLLKQIETRLNQHAQKLDYLSRRLISPTQELENKLIKLNQFQHRLNLGVDRQLDRQKQLLLRLGASLSQLNPENVFARGYALIQNQEGHVIYDSQKLNTHELIKIRLYKGEVTAEVKSIKP